METGLTMDKTLLTTLQFLLICCGLAACVPDHWPQKWVDLAKPKAQAAPVADTSQWCYRSLAQIDCYAAPREDAKDRLVVAPPPNKSLPQRSTKPMSAANPVIETQPLPPPLPLYPPRPH
jgi:hypothetical protein